MMQLKIKINLEIKMISKNKKKVFNNKILDRRVPQSQIRID